MNIRFQCPHCNHTYISGDDRVGRSFRCVQCGESVKVPNEAPVANEGPKAETKPAPQRAVVRSRRSRNASAPANDEGSAARRGRLTKRPPSPIGRVVTFAGIAAILGVAAWVAIALLSGYEVSLLAIGIGLLSGFAAISQGAFGTRDAVIVGGIALVAVLAGQLLTTHFIIQKELGEYRDNAVAAYDHLTEASKQLRLWEASHGKNGKLKRFMLEMGYAENEAGADAALDEFIEIDLPAIRAIQEGRTAEEFGDWEVERLERLNDTSAVGVISSGEDPTALLYVFVFMALAAGAAGSMVLKQPAYEREEDEE